MEFTMKSKPFICKDIKSVLNEIDDLKKMLTLLTAQFESELEEMNADFTHRLKTQMSKFRADDQKRLDNLLLQKNKLQQETRDMK
jgi:hypothetical protein